jgi:hypothetical protein
MKAWEVTSMTNFMLAGEAFLAAGFLLGRAPLHASAASFWALAMLFLAASMLVGGLDHGFFEQKGDTRDRMIMQKITWVCGGIMTFFTLLTTRYQFASGGLRVTFIIVGLVQLVIFCFLAVRIHNFLVVIINYTPILIVLLILNTIGISAGSGSWYMIVGILISIAASAFQALAVDIFAPVDRNGLYHIVMMAAVIFLFLASFTLKG